MADAAQAPDTQAESYRVTGELRLIELLLGPPDAPELATALGAPAPSVDGPTQTAYVSTTADASEEDRNGGW